MMGIFGWGNPIYGEDALGILTAKKIKEMNPPQHVTVNLSTSSPFSLVAKFLHYDKVVVIDVCQDKDEPEGELFKWEVSEKEEKRHMLSPHSASLFSVINLYKRRYPEEFPKEILIYGMYVHNLDLNEEMPEEIRRKSDKLAKLIFNDIRREKNR